MIEINRLRVASTQTRVVQPDRQTSLIKKSAVNLVIGVAGPVDLRESLSDSLIAESIHFYYVDAARGIPRVTARVRTLESRGARKGRRSIGVAGRFDPRRCWIYSIDQDLSSDPNSDYVAIKGRRFRLAATRGPLTHASSDRGVQPRWTKERVDVQDKSVSFCDNAPPRRSTWLLGVPQVTNGDSLYRELRPEMDALTVPLFEFSELCIRKRGGFLPHGAVLTGDGQIILVGASVAGATVDTLAAPADLLPTLHEGLREAARERGGIATAISEDVTITRDGEGPTQAIKVLFEHQRGLTVALYTPFTKSLFRGYRFLSMISKIAAPEVNAWSDT